MNVLVGWDDPAEAETIRLLLNVDNTFAKVVTEAEQFSRAVSQGGWDVLIQALCFPDRDGSLTMFQESKSINGQLPVIGVWREDEISELARFISHGLHSHLMRDPQGNFLFLLTAMATAAKSATQVQQAALHLQQEMNSVRRLQDSVIPRELPQPADYRIAARYESSQIQVSGFVPVAMAGGDYYDVFPLENDSLMLLAGDASGHGIKACMSIMTMHTLIRTMNWNRHTDTGDIVKEVNQRMCSSDIIQDEGGFITLLCCKLNPKRHQLQWTSAGAPMPVLQDLKTNRVTSLSCEDQAGLPLAIEDDWCYQHFVLDIPQCSRLLIYTDGLEEAFPIDEVEYDPFGIDGIITSLQRSVDSSIEEALESLFNDSNAHTRGQGRIDDTSAILVERLNA